jgi:predicted NBD/HSP70 family sugar kinase
MPFIVEHDVTACARAEWRKGGHYRPAHREHDTSLFGYVRVGTGVGVEILRDGWVLHQNRRGESGHIPICIDPRDRLDESTCRQHAQCIEGYVSATAIARRKGLSEEDKTDLLGTYIGQLIASLTMFTMPYTVVLGGNTMLTGGGMPNHALYEKVRRGCWKWLGNYPAYRHQDDLGKYIRQASMRVEHAAITGTAEMTRNEIRG